MIIYPDIMNPGLFDDQDLVDLFSYMPHYDGTVAPSQIFTPPSPNDDWAIWFEVYDTCTSVSLALDETGHSADLEQSQDDKKGPKHGAGFEVPRETLDANQQSQTGYSVVPRNTFPCRNESCGGKDHKPKCFRRKCHRDRHERTVHPNGMHILHRCWVRGCKSTPFTRADNLRNHLKKTHGKKSWSGKYRYVATQDELSIHYDPEWTGEIGDDGSPRSI